MVVRGYVLKPGQKETISAPKGEPWHLTQVCLHEPRPGKTYVQVHVSGRTFTVVCLEKGKVEHRILNLVFRQDVAFSLTGGNEVHMLGYLERDVVSAGRARGGVTEEAATAAREEYLEQLGRMLTETDPPPNPGDIRNVMNGALEHGATDAEVSAARQYIQTYLLGEFDKILANPQAPGAKRKAEGPAASAPPSKEKKRSTNAAASQAAVPDRAAAFPNTAAAAAAATAGVGAPKAVEAEYTKALMEFLRKHGKTNTSRLGGEVRRPKGVPKMKVIFIAHEEHFVVTGDEVELR